MKKTFKTRQFPESNYKSIHINGKSLRIALDPSKPITELKYSEFYDIKLTNKCFGRCKFCYMSSETNDPHFENIIGKFKSFFGNMSDNEKPFQIAYGGGEPTLHPDFCKLMKVTYDHDITPNFTSNGMFIDDEKLTKKIVTTTKKYCGGVAFSTHPHLEHYWRKATELFIEEGIHTNFHVIISDKKSIDSFLKLYKEFKGRIKYFVLLPYAVVGRAKPKKLDYDYLFENLNKMDDIADIAFGANFYPYLKEGKLKSQMSLYEPEVMSRFIDFKDMKIYPSSFKTDKALN